MAAATSPIDYTIDLGTRDRRRNGRISAMFSLLKCCSWSAVSSRSQHFHASRVQDSVHVMIKHDLKAAKHKGEKPGTGYVPRAPLPDHLMKVTAIQATETADESTEDRDILAALREQ